MSLLGFMAGGAATAYRDASNAQVDQINKIESAIFSAELADVYQQRVEQRRGAAEQATYERDRADKIEDRNIERTYKEEDQEVSHKQASALQRQRDDAAMARTRFSESEGTKRSGILASARKSGKDDAGTDPAKVSQHLNKLGAERRKILQELSEIRGSSAENPHARALQEDARRIEREMRATEAVLLEKRAGGFNKAVQFPSSAKPTAASSAVEIGRHVREQGSR